jgi:hypothetical protein
MLKLTSWRLICEVSPKRKLRLLPLNSLTPTGHCNTCFVCLWLCSPFVVLKLLFQFINSLHSRYDSLAGMPARRTAATYTQNERTQTSMPWVGFEPAIPTFRRAKRVHAVDRAATVIGITCFSIRKLCIVPAVCIWLFRTVLTINSSSFPKEH